MLSPNAKLLHLLQKKKQVTYLKEIGQEVLLEGINLLSRKVLLL
jgi:hypothetical protein